jgi:hypothetical protein
MKKVTINFKMDFQGNMKLEQLYQRIAVISGKIKWSAKDENINGIK